MRPLILFLCVLAAAAPCRAVDLHIQFAALQRMLAEQAFTQEGRRYVRGSKDNRCNFAYLERPEVGGEGGRLKVRARFTGRTALDVFGRCVGLGDAFDVTIFATPLYRDGYIGLKDVRVDSNGRTGIYIRRVCAAMTQSLEKDFRYPVAAEARRVLEDPGSHPDYRRQLHHFQVTGIRVSSDALVLAIDLALVVR